MNMKWYGLLSIITAVVFLSACSSQPVQSFNRAVIQIGENVGLVHYSTMKVPDYYSTKQLEKKYELGTVYRVNDIDCSQAAKDCQ
ncbi:hypothetical protein THMIRHAM_07380 [Thiomicrorhabdus immobilis]|uniref:Lipoprotein n=1 Tax=Thiomicrorhabdus immobilis TaxID=2791037 RepID=A0ABM7MC45_9GAMM|nr:hypothetical protein [Thiomicrorhabdus immobilis]BCN92953.1 hypothetical protein THMIRHAM_07380 [Thiomicrorhabdus immobilis]